MDTMGDDSWDDFDDVEGLDVVGETRAPARGLNLALTRRQQRRPARPEWTRTLTGQGISHPAEELDVLPFQVTQFAAGVLAAGAASFAEGFPQRPFRGERLIATAIRTNAGVSADVSGAIFITPAWYVGAVQVGASQGTIPLATFAPTAFGVRLAVPPAGQGTRVFIPFQLGFAQVAGDVTVISFALIGRAVR
jgi:hypothetical protein